MGEKTSGLYFEITPSSRLAFVASGPIKRALNLAAGKVKLFSESTQIDNHEHPYFEEEDSGYDIYADLLEHPWPIGDNTYDVVYAFHVIEHFSIDEAPKFLKECLRIVRPTGMLIMETPEAKTAFKEYLEGNIGMITCMFGRDNRYGNQHRHLYDREGLATLLLSIGWMHVFTGDALCYHHMQIPSFRIEAVKP